MGGESMIWGSTWTKALIIMMVQRKAINPCFSEYKEGGLFTIVLLLPRHCCLA